jgi:hypothetical protein
MIRIIAKLFAVAVALAICLPVQPSSAQEALEFVSATGGGSTCTQTAPCATILAAFSNFPSPGGRIVCMTPVSQAVNFAFGSGTAVFDCPLTSWIGEAYMSGINPGNCPA